MPASLSPFVVPKPSFLSPRPKRSGEPGSNFLSAIPSFAVRLLDPGSSPGRRSGCGGLSSNIQHRSPRRAHAVKACLSARFPAPSPPSSPRPKRSGEPGPNFLSANPSPAVWLSGPGSSPGRREWVWRPVIEASNTDPGASPASLSSPSAPRSPSFVAPAGAKRRAGVQSSIRESVPFIDANAGSSPGRRSGWGYLSSKIIHPTPIPPPGCAREALLLVSFRPREGRRGQPSGWSRILVRAARRLPARGDILAAFRLLPRLARLRASSVRNRG